MIVHHGAVVAEWGDTAAKTPLASVRKSLLSALIGIAVERGEIDLAQPIGALGIDDNEPSLTAEEKRDRGGSADCAVGHLPCCTL
jgi:CubicO group peptidase (beta-lactamase class C family)